jgi:RimJ/RimL family protein N-acetyltransferase
MNPPRRIEDSVVALRDVVPSDGETIFGYLTTDPDIAKWTRIPWPYTRGHLSDFMTVVGRTQTGRSDIVLAITEPGNDELLGCIGLHRIGGKTVPRSALLPDEIGYWIGREARNRGLVTRAVRLLSAYALAELGVTTINLQTKVGNLASQTVARKAGYRFVRSVPASEVDDDLSDHDRYVLTRADYERANGRLDTVTSTGPRSAS